MSFRKEKKFALSYSDLQEIKKKMFNLGMEKLFPSRIINNCYFDTKNLNIFFDSEEGVLPRKKIRVRWYEKKLEFKKEVKVSSIEGRYKYDDLLTSIKSIDDIKKLFFFDNEYGDLYPILTTHYEREYFMLKKLRITFDKNISYFNLRKGSTINYKDKECVMEIKTSIDCGEDYIKNIVSIPDTRFSKYSRGILISTKTI